MALSFPFFSHMTTLFEAQEIRKDYPRSSFQLKVPKVLLGQGSITGVVGENGNGKTTLLNIIAGRLKAEGTMRYFGESPSASNSWSLIKDKIAFIPQRIPRWYGSLIQNLQLKAALEGIPAAQIDDYLDDILNFLDLQQYRNLYWTEISTGYRLRFELARVLIGKPNLLVLDEPLANLDINTQQKFLSDLKNILRDKDYPTAVVLSSQQLHEIEAVADHMIFLKAGTAIFSGANTELSENDQTLLEFQVIDDQLFETWLTEHNLDHKRSGEYFQVGGDFEIPQLINQLFNAGIQLKYFRDISSSTKRLFND